MRHSLANHPSTSVLAVLLVVDTFRRFIVFDLDSQPSRRIYTEEKPKVVAAAWGFLKFLALLAVLQKDDLRNRMICTRTI